MRWVARNQRDGGAWGRYCLIARAALQQRHVIIKGHFNRVGIGPFLVPQHLGGRALESGQPKCVKEERCETLPWLVITQQGLGWRLRQINRGRRSLRLLPSIQHVS